MRNKVNDFIKNTLIFLLGSFGSKFMSFLFLPSYTSILTTTQYGEIDIISTTQSLLFPLVTVGLSEAIFRYIMNKEVENNSVLSNGVIIISVSYVVTTIIILIANRFIHWNNIYWMLGLLAASIIYDMLTNYLKAIQMSKKYVVIGLLFTFINLTGNILLLVVFRMGMQGYLIAYILAFLIPSFIVFGSEKLYKNIRFKYFDIKLAKRMLHYSFPLIFTSLSWWIMTSSDKYMIQFFLGSADVGIYSVASKIPLILQTLISIIQMVWQISTNQIHDEEPEQLRKSFELFTKAFREIGFVSGSVLIILTQPIMAFIARNDFYNGWIYAPFLILSIVFSFSTGMVSTLYGAYEKNTGVLYSVLLGGGVNIILNLLFIPQIGVIGATISTAVSRFIIAIYRLKDTEKLLKFNRGYKSTMIGCFLISMQCIMLLLVKNYTYLIQFVFFVFVCVLCKDIFINSYTFLKKLWEEKK